MLIYLAKLIALEVI